MHLFFIALDSICLNLINDFMFFVTFLTTKSYIVLILNPRACKCNTKT